MTEIVTHRAADDFAQGYDEAARDDAKEFARLDARVAELEGELSKLRASYGLLEIIAGTLAVHVRGHFAMASETSPVICQSWADAVQRTIADNAVK
jgi:hypothetical protein